MAGNDGSRITRSIGCFGDIENAGGLRFAYTAVLFSSGSVFVSAEIKDDARQSSGARVFAPSQNGAANASVIVTYDAFAPQNAGFWVLSLDRTTLVVTLEYNDSDLPDAGHRRLWTMTPDKCVSNTY